MPSNKTAIALILISLPLLGLTLYDVFFSGTSIQEFQLQGRAGKTNLISVEPDMNPLRLLFSMDYSSGRFGGSMDYEVSAYQEDGAYLWNDTGHVWVESGKIHPSSTHSTSLQTFDVHQPTSVEFRYNIEPGGLRYQAGALTLKRNVARPNLLVTVTGLCLLVAGVLIYATNNWKNST